jgi:hypothetical protein
MAKSNKLKKTIVAKTDFETFFNELKQKDFNAVFPSGYQYASFRTKIFDGTDIPQSKDALQITNELFGGWDGIKHVLEALWGKFLGNKFGSQTLANFVFKLLIGGVEDGWKAIIGFVKKKVGDDVETDVTSIVGSLNEIFVEHKADEIFTQITDIHTQITTDINKPTVVEGEVKKPGTFLKILRSIGSVLRFVVTLGKK